MTSQPTPPPPPSYGSTALSPSDDKLWGSLANFGNILGFLPSLLIYLILKDRGTIVRREARVALNWIIAVTAVVVVLIIVQAIINIAYFASPYGAGGILSVLSLLVGLVYWAVIIVNLIFSIINGVRVNNGGNASYPINLNLIK